jgi:hypothetical protein
MDNDYAEYHADHDHCPKCGGCEFEGMNNHALDCRPPERLAALEALLKEKN